MSKFITLFQVFLILIFFTGKELEATFMAPCFEILKESAMEPLMKFEGERRFGRFCMTMRSFYFCINTYTRLHTGMDIKVLANHSLIKGTEVGKIFIRLINIEDIVEEVCTKGSKLQERKELEAYSLRHCVAMGEFKDNMESLVNLKGAERLHIVCTSIQSFIRCVNNAVRAETGMPVKEFANHWLVKGTEAGKFMNAFVNIEDFIEEICTEGTYLHNEYMMLDEQCLRHRRDKSGDRCQHQAINALEIYRELPEEIKYEQSIDECVKTAYFLGCIGASLHDDCGDEAFERYKIIVKRTGYFRSGICSSDLIKTLNTTLVESLNMSNSRRNLYRMIFSLKKRRK